MRIYDEYDEYDEEFDDEESDEENETENDNSSEDEENDETEEKNRLLDTKYRLILTFNADALDIDEFNRSMKNINQSLEDLTFINDYYNSELVNKEYYFMDVLNTYVGEIQRNRTPGFLAPAQIKSLENLYSEIKDLRIKNVEDKLEDDEPLESKTLEENLKDLLKKEKSYLHKVASAVFKKGLTKELIQEPLESEFQDQREYSHAYDQYIRKISKFIPKLSVVQNMNVTSIGSSFDKYQQTLSEKLIELKEFQENLPVIVSKKDEEYFKRRNALKNIMLKININTLIQSAIEVETTHEYSPEPIKQSYKFDPIVLDKIIKYRNSQRDENTNLRINQKNRDTALSNLKNIYDSTFMNNLEREIYEYSNNNANVYINKINDIIFILTNYPNFKTLIKNGTINAKQLALFEKEIAFETLISITPINSRRNSLKQIKVALTKNTLYNGLFNNFKSHVLAKKLELLIYDISKNNKIYTNTVKKLIDYIHKDANKVFKDRLEKTVLFLQLNLKSKYQPEFPKLDLKGVEALISQENVKIEQIEKEIELIKYNILEWKVPIQAMSHEKEFWKRLVQKYNEEFGKLTFKLTVKGLQPLLDYRKLLIKKYKLPDDERLIHLNKKIQHSKKRIKFLTKRLIQLRKKQEEFNFIPVDLPPFQRDEITINSNVNILNEATQAVKRKLMIDSLTKESYETKNKVLPLLELLDINDAVNKDPIIQRKLAGIIVQLLPNGYIFTDFNNYYYNEANKIINGYLNKYNSDNNTGQISFVPGQGITDYYGYFIFDKVYLAKQPIDFYSKEIQNKFFKLVEESTIKKEPEYKRLKILYNPYTGVFSDPTGYLFDVEKLRSKGDNQPLLEEEPFTQINARTGEIEHGTHLVPIPGNDSFIKVPILTNKRGVFNYQWIKVPSGKVPQMYLSTADTCNRFRSIIDCNSGKGLGNTSCYYDKKNKICKADYQGVHQKFKDVDNMEYYSEQAGFDLQFGKRKVKVKIPIKKEVSGIKYTLTMSQKERQKALVKRILFEKKKTGKTLKKSAIAVKKRLIVLRTFRKNNSKFKKQITILNKDINFINKKYLV